MGRCTARHATRERGGGRGDPRRGPRSRSRAQLRAPRSPRRVAAMADRPGGDQHELARRRRPQHRPRHRLRGAGHLAPGPARVRRPRAAGRCDDRGAPARASEARQPGDQGLLHVAPRHHGAIWITRRRGRRRARCPDGWVVYRGSPHRVRNSGQPAATRWLPRENLPAVEDTAKLVGQWAIRTESTRGTRTKPS